MPSVRSAEILRASLPAVREAIGEITTVFYDRLFAAHPELLRDLFNRGNQANGTQRRALAAAFVAFAAATVDPAIDRTFLDRIAHKHVSLGITHEQYPIVRTHLVGAIRQVLGDAATEPVIAAWDEVYTRMAEELIGIEAKLYASAGVEPGDTGRAFRVVGRTRVTEDVSTFELRAADGLPAPAFRAGQYVSVRVELADGAARIRQYSLSSACADPLRISVKRVADDPAGEVSTFLHTRVGVGDRLQVSHPFGDVTLDDEDGPLLLASAGIGCAPINAMLAQLAAERSTRQVMVVHADRDERADPFVELEKLVAHLPNATAHVWYEHPGRPWPADRTGYADLRVLPIPASVTAYLCGPTPFLRAMRAHLRELGVRGDRVHYEVFGPDTWLDAD